MSEAKTSMARLNEIFPGRPSWKVILFIVALFLIGVVYGIQKYSSHSESGTSATQKKEVYNCPMHPSVISDQPGICPVCHMDLQKVDDGGVDEHSGSPSDTHKERKILFYRNPMNPSVTSKVPAKDEMGMDYVAVYDDEVSDSAVTTVDGRSSFNLSQERQQLIGVKTTTVQTRPLNFEIRATGRVAFDPELYTTIEEYKQAVQSRREMGANPYPGLKEQADELISSAKTKLRLMGLTDDQIRGLSRANAMNLLLPKGTVWVYAEVFEYEAAGLKVGQNIEATASTISGKVFTGKIAAISPILNAPTRTIRVRAEVPDPENLLRPDTYLNVKIKIDLGTKLAVPEDAVLHSGQQTFVFIVKGQGKFEPKAVVVGKKTNNFYEVLDGLSDGDSVVVGANFLIDSESRLRSALQNMGSGEHK